MASQFGSEFSLQFVDGAHPEHLYGRARAVHPPGDFVEGQALEVAKNDDFAVVRIEPGQRVGNGQLSLFLNEHLARRVSLIGGVKEASREGGVRGGIQRHFAAGLALVSAVELADEVGGVVREDAPQPGQPFSLGDPLKPAEAAVCLQHGLLHDVGRVDLSLQPGFHLRAGKDAEIVAAALEEPVASGDVAGASLQQQISHTVRFLWRHLRQCNPVHSAGQSRARILVAMRLVQEINAVLAQLDRELWVVTASDGDQRGGLIATFVSQASIVPEMPRVLVGIAKQHHTRRLIEASSAFALHLLDETKLEWVWRFGLQSGHAMEKLAGLAWQAGATGSPLLREALAWLECRVEAGFDTGDRTVYLAEIVAGKQASAAAPLTFKRLMQLAPPERLAEMKGLLARDAQVDAAAIGSWRERAR